MRVAYLVHDLNDPAVARRVAMLRAAGVEVALSGFWRGGAPPTEVAGVRPRALARTFDARLLGRAASVLFCMARSQGRFRSNPPVDVVLARNLEMLAVAVTAKRRSGASPAIVYEALDLHRLLLSQGAAGSVLRALERVLLADTELLITSSPAFLHKHFEKRQFRRRAIPALIVENKPFEPIAAPEVRAEPPPAPPWRIGWFGMIRCRRSADMLFGLAKRRPDLVQVHIAGRPTRAVFPDFEDRLDRATGVRFMGPYAPSDLARLYSGVHFNWAIDWFEDGGNSEWLLPNRIYEGGSCNAVPIARGGTETARWLAANGLGVALGDPASELENFLEALSWERYRSLREAVCAAPRSLFIAERGDCERLASALKQAVAAPSRHPGRRTRQLDEMSETFSSLR